MSNLNRDLLEALFAAVQAAPAAERAALQAALEAYTTMYPRSVGPHAPTLLRRVLATILGATELTIPENEETDR